MTVAKKAVPKELLDSLLADYRKPEDLIGEHGLLKQLTKLLVENRDGRSPRSWQERAGRESGGEHP
jgi:hypothetical protein